MEPINKDDFFRITRENQGVPASHHTLIALYDQEGNIVRGLYLTTGPTDWEQCVLGQYTYHLTLDRDGCEKL